MEINFANNAGNGNEMTLFSREIAARRSVIARFVFLLCFCLLSFNASACTCRFAGFDELTISDAESIIVFRITDIKSAGRKQARATIAVIESLRGPRRRLRHIRYSTDACCGARLDVGVVYALFGTALTFPVRVHPGNILILGRQFDAAAASRLLSVVQGEQKLEDVFPRSWRERVEQDPVKPPPCSQ